MSDCQTKLIVAVAALSKIAFGPSFGGKSTDQMLAMNALDVIKQLDQPISPTPHLEERR